MKISAVILFLMLSTSSALAQTDTSSIRAEVYKRHIAIFPASFTDLIPGHPFTPTHAEIDRAEKALMTQLARLNDRRINQTGSPVIHENLRKYKRQYFDFLDSKGNRILFINCLWAKDKSYSEVWLKSRTMVLDGGSYFWNIKFNLIDGKLFDLDVNGYG